MFHPVQLDAAAAKIHLRPMSTLQEIESHARGLPASERAKLAASLLSTLPPILMDDDDGLAEALRRDAEMDRDPTSHMSDDEFRTAVLRSRKR